MWGMIGTRVAICCQGITVPCFESRDGMAFSEYGHLAAVPVQFVEQLSVESFLIETIQKIRAVPDGSPRHHHGDFHRGTHQLDFFQPPYFFTPPAGGFMRLGAVGLPLSRSQQPSPPLS